MKHFFTIYIPKPVKFLLFIAMVIIAGCSLEKQSGFNRNMQNLTAHYNILFNAKELLRLKQESYASTFVDNFNDILSVYPDTTAQSTTPDKDLEAVLLKANNIITLKEQSKYLGDAYLLIGKANYLEANYFNAVEYFSYVIRSFPMRKDLTIEASSWKARTLIYLKELPQAKLALDTAFRNIDEKKKKTADPYAAKLQYDINVQDYADGEAMAKEAILYSNDRVQKLRWRFILAQLQELNQKPNDAIQNYGQIARSNAQFEMAFNASLNRIRIEENQDGVKISRIDRLRSLLKDPNNKEFKDQIYYQIGELQMAAKKTDDAVKNYNLSVRSSFRNQSQKGLSYLRLAQINFKIKGDYIKAKKYYDSTLTSLPTNYPGYLAIQKIGNNLQLLSDRLQVIAREDTLQALAKMDEATRDKLIDKMVSDHVLQQQADIRAAAANSSGDPDSGGPRSLTGSSGGKSSFYFYNTAAISQGLTDFKTKWGNRKLEDNWRRSNRSNSDITNNTAPSNQVIDPDAPIGAQANGKVNVNAGNYRKDLVNALPLTPVLLQQSNQRLYNAYVDVGNFYRDILEDKKEAIAEFEFILQRFPNDPNKPAIYYNLYRLYSGLDVAKSDYYKNKILKEFPETAFAKVILDPEYAKKMDDKDAEFITAYNAVFDLYAKRKYQDVIAKVPQLMMQYPANKYSAQLAYLKIISEGHGERGQSFTDSLKQVVAKFPDDKLVTPLVNQHLTYIAANLADIMARPVVLNDNDPNEIPFTLNPANQEQTAYRPVIKPGPPQPEEKKPEKKEPVATPPAATAVVPPPVTAPVQPAAIAPQIIPPVTTPQTITAVVPAITQPGMAEPDAGVPTLFATSDTTNYYLVINVSSGTTNLSSSRFGIGQFNRANYAGKGIRHELMPVEANNQLIYVGRFYSLDDVKAYARRVVPLLPDIMKVPKDKYSFFIITKQNLDKLADKKTLDSYTDYYQKNF